MEWEASGWPRVQLKSTLTEPPLVVMFKLASPPKDENFMNSVTVAPRNWELDADMLDLEEKLLSGHMITLCSGIVLYSS